MKIPNCFIIGEPKSGTNTIFHNLKDHPDIFFPQKEINYFINDLKEEADIYHGNKNYFKVRTLDQYLSIFKDYKNQRICGEASVMYIKSKSSAKEIYEYNPNAKIIALFREPVSFLYSYFHYEKSAGRENESDFLKVLLDTENRLKGKNISKYVQTPSTSTNLSLVNYTEELKRFVDLFPKDNIKVIITEKLKENPDKIFKELCDFLGIDYYSVDIKNHNIGKTLDNKNIFFRFYRYISSNLYLNKIIPEKIYTSLRNKIFEIFRTDEYPKLNPDVELSLKKIFKDDLIKFEKFLKENNLYDENLLDIWGYKDIS